MGIGDATRRAVLAAVLGAAGPGCLGDTSSEDHPEEVGLPDVEVPDVPERVTFAHWFDGADERLAAAIRDRLSDGVEIDPRPYAGRRPLEVAVAEGLVAGSPPDCFQTVLGEELRRYVDAVTVHHIRDVLPPDSRDRYRARVTDLIAFDDDPYALPVTIDRTNGLCVNAAVLETVGAGAAELSHPDDLLATLGAIAGETDAVGMALPADGRWVFRLFCLLLLGRAGPAAYEGLAAADVPAVDLRAAVADVWTLLEDAAELVPDLDAAAAMFSGGGAAVMPADRRAAELLDAIAGARLLPFPGTGRTFLLHATGWCFPKRSGSPRGTAAVLESLARRDVQAAIASATDTIPARWDAEESVEASPYAAELRRDYRESDRVIRAASTGCGLDPDDRRRAIGILEPRRVRTEGPGAIGDALLELFR